MYTECGTFVNIISLITKKKEATDICKYMVKSHLHLGTETFHKSMPPCEIRTAVPLGLGIRIEWQEM